ncbi:MAG: pyridoxal phosphate-dependent aminotransferase [Chloroflexi bacterium]|nr:pyridoxal phosphate-dependent aminotransferase [Chloroflexota bacterium]MCC6893157.1 pyridoxal phosphate-dependent aminotransferase [Anaerolineae bacterium]
MTVPTTLSRPLASRIAGLPAFTERKDGAAVSERVIEAAVKALDKGETHYTDRPGIVGLRTWVTDHIGKNFGVELQPGEITITCGVTEGRFVVAKQLTKPGSQIVCPGDTSVISGAAHLAQATVVSDVTDPVAVSMVYLTPQDDWAVVDKLLQQAAEHKWWIIWDISSGIGENKFHPAQDPRLVGQVVTLGSLSDKMPGWRVGWMAGSEKAGKLRAFKQSVTICTTNVSQWAALGLVDEA